MPNWSRQLAHVAAVGRNQTPDAAMIGEGVQRLVVRGDRRRPCRRPRHCQARLELGAFLGGAPALARLVRGDAVVALAGLARRGRLARCPRVGAFELRNGLLCGFKFRLELAGGMNHARESPGPTADERGPGRPIFDGQCFRCLERIVHQR